MIQEGLSETGKELSPEAGQYIQSHMATPSPTADDVL
jgi:hypothetical protein